MCAQLLCALPTRRTPTARHGLGHQPFGISYDFEGRTMMKRTATTARRNLMRGLLSLLAISQAIFYPFLFFLIVYDIQAAIYLFIFRMAIFLPNLILLMRKMECKDLIHKAILMDFLFFLYYWYVSFRWISTKKISWN